MSRPPERDAFLEHFLPGSNQAIGVEDAAECSLEERRLYSARAYEQVGREIGFTAGRTLAFAGCLLALEEGRIAEIDHMFEAVYEAAKTELDEHLIFSGGSRFDREFLIRVRPEIKLVLRARIDACRQSPTPGGHDGRF